MRAVQASWSFRRNLLGPLLILYGWVLVVGSILSLFTLTRDSDLSPGIIVMAAGIFALIGYGLVRLGKRLRSG
jgi:4-amino-4-deoxy-L-arabinose transferase-like glycosyltransferase